jgi:hypothetical protein
VSSSSNILDAKLRLPNPKSRIVERGNVLWCFHADWNLLHLQQKTNVQIRNALCEVSYISTRVRLAFCSVICANCHALITKICIWRYVCPDGKYTHIYKLRLQIHTRLVDTDVIYIYMVYEWMKRWLLKHLPHAPILT